MDLLPALPAAERSQIRTIAEDAATRKGLVRLDIGQPDLPVPRPVKAAAAAAADRDTGYTPTAGIPELREALARDLTERHGSVVAADEIFVTTGGTNAVALALAATAAPGDTVLVPQLHWPNLRAMARLLRCHLDTYRLDPVTLIPDVDALIAQARSLRPASIVLNSPGNPTGAVIPPEGLMRIIDATDELGVWVVADEVYDECSYDAPHIGARSRQARNVIAVHSFSKTYSMTGYRLGYVNADRALIEMLTPIQEGAVTCTNAIAQSAGLAALALDRSLLGERRAEYRRRRDLVERLIDDTRLKWVRPRGAFYALVELRPGSARDGLALARTLMIKHHVAVAPGSAFGEGSIGRVRVSLAASDGSLAAGIAALSHADRSNA